MRAIQAERSGRCGLCDQGIIPEVDEIVLVDDEWVHVECAEDEGAEIER